MNQYFGITVTLIILLAPQFSLQDKLHSSFSYEAPEFVIDLDESAEERWKSVAERFTSEIRKLIDASYVMAEKRFNMTRQELKKDFTALAHALEKKTYLTEYFKEIAGISKYSKIAKEELYFLGLHIDFILKSTTVVATSKNGVVWVFKTFHLNATKEARKTTINVKFRLKKKTVATATTLAGLVGILMGKGCAVSGCVISYNRRVTKQTLKERLKEALKLVGESKLIWPPSFLVRKTILDEATFDDAKYNATLTYFDKKVNLTTPSMFSVSMADRIRGGKWQSKVSDVVFRKQIIGKVDHKRRTPGGMTSISDTLVFGSYDWKFPENIVGGYDNDETFCASSNLNRAMWNVNWQLRAFRKLKGKTLFFKVNFKLEDLLNVGFFATQANTAIFTITSPKLEIFFTTVVTNNSALIPQGDGASFIEPSYLVLLLNFFCIRLMH